MAVTFTNNQIDGAIVGESRQAYQSKINSAGVVTTADLAAEIAENLKESANFVESLLKELTAVAKEKLGEGNRVLLDGLCRLELYGEGTFATQDESWDSEQHRIIVRALPYDDVKFALKNVVPVNTLSKVTIQLLGAQDATTLEQNALTIGNTLLLQGKNVQVVAGRADEGVFLVNDEHTYKGTVVASTAGTADVTFADATAGEYTLELRGRAGLGLNRSLVTARISGFVVKAAA